MALETKIMLQMLGKLAQRTDDINVLRKDIIEFERTAEVYVSETLAEDTQKETGK